MDSAYQQMMIQALMGGVAQPGVMPNSQNPTSGYGQSFITGNPTTPGGMQGNNPYAPVNPNAQQMGQQMNGQGQMGNPFQLQQPYQQYQGTGGPDGGGGGADSR